MKTNIARSYRERCALRRIHIFRNFNKIIYLQSFTSTCLKQAENFVYPFPLILTLSQKLY